MCFILISGCNTRLLGLGKPSNALHSCWLSCASCSAKLGDPKLFSCSKTLSLRQLCHLMGRNCVRTLWWVGLVLVHEMSRLRLYKWGSVTSIDSALSKFKIKRLMKKYIMILPLQVWPQSTCLHLHTWIQDGLKRWRQHWALCSWLCLLFGPKLHLHAPLPVGRRAAGLWGKPQDVLGWSSVSLQTIC